MLTWTRDGGWAPAYADSPFIVFNDLLITPAGAVAVAGDQRLLYCSSGCDQAGSWRVQTEGNKTFFGLCQGAGQLYAVGRNDQSAAMVFRWQGVSWSQVPLSRIITNLYACDVLADGTVLLSGTSGLSHTTASGTVTDDALSPACQYGNFNRRSRYAACGLSAWGFTRWASIR